MKNKKNNTLYYFSHINQRDFNILHYNLAKNSECCKAERSANKDDEYWRENERERVREREQ